MKRIIILIAFFAAALSAKAQQDPQFSQYMYNKLFMNPAFAGMKHSVCFTGIYRNQWNGFDGAPNSGVFSGDIWLNKWGGAGLTILFDQLGFEKNMQVKGAYSFHINEIFGNGSLGIGLELGVLSKRIGPGGSDQWIATTNWQNDGSIPPQLRQGKMDLGFGLWYEQERVYFGISTSHLPSSSFSGTSYNGTPLTYQMARHYFITGGWNSGRPGDTWQIKPSFLVKSDATVTSFDLNCTAVFNDRFWAGISYRYQDAIVPMIGFQTATPKNYREPVMKFGFAYDYNTSRLSNYNNGSFEIFVAYCHPIAYKPSGHGCSRFFE